MCARGLNANAIFFDCFFLFLDKNKPIVPKDVPFEERLIVSEYMAHIDALIFEHATNNQNFAYIDAICDAIDLKYYKGNFRILETMDHINLRDISNNFQV